MYEQLMIYATHAHLSKARAIEVLMAAGFATLMPTNPFETQLYFPIEITKGDDPNG